MLLTHTSYLKVNTIAFSAETNEVGYTYLACNLITLLLNYVAIIEVSLSEPHLAS